MDLVASSPTAPTHQPSADLGALTDLSFAAVIFDMDGTLIDSTPAVRRSWKTWAAEHEVAADVLERNHGMPAASVVQAALSADRHDAAIRRINELELADVGDVVVLPGAPEALASLVGAKNAIATSCTIPLAQARIAAAGVVAPTVLVTADDVERGKPHPDPFLEAARRLGVAPTDCLVVEDAPAGLAAARTAGCRTLAVRTTTPTDELDADAIIETLADVAFEADADGRISVRLRVPGS